MRTNAYRCRPFCSVRAAGPGCRPGEGFDCTSFPTATTGTEPTPSRWTSFARGPPTYGGARPAAAGSGRSSGCAVTAGPQGTVVSWTSLVSPLPRRQSPDALPRCPTAVSGPRGGLAGSVPPGRGSRRSLPRTTPLRPGAGIAICARAEFLGESTWTGRFQRERVGDRAVLPTSQTLFGARPTRRAPGGSGEGIIFKIGQLSWGA